MKLIKFMSLIKFMKFIRFTKFIKLMKFATGGMFLHNDRLFKQVDGVAMGSPLGPSLANFFLGYLEETRFFNDSSIKPKLYVRYVDDIFAVFDKDLRFQPFLNHINNQHANIKFTVEESIGTTYLRGFCRDRTILVHVSSWFVYSSFSMRQFSRSPSSFPFTPRWFSRFQCRFFLSVEFNFSLSSLLRFPPALRRFFTFQSLWLLIFSESIRFGHHGPVL